MSGYGTNDEHLTRLALAARDGDRAATAEFLTATQRDVIRFVAHLAGPGDAADIAQDTFMRAMKALPAFEGRSSARTWLLSIARHTVLDHLRAQSRRPQLAALPDWAAVADAAQSPQSHRFDEQVLLEQLIAQLDPDRREAFVTTQILGLSYAEAADVIGCPVGTIRSRVARARDDLATALSAEGTGARRHLRAV
ncbi:sigma-70 family RNA polymerase sigma factor [Rhizocola hellebori]|nr:sigma-70 family RNA polymerase sigma factor [Rhizocola hellebori]